MEKNDQDTYKSILEGDRMARARFSGHGSAIAQAYNHMIMPLASRRDKITQVKWGIEDFIYRFQRYPEGMWLPETAVDTETLEVLALHDIKFTILAPHQAKRIRKIGDDWSEMKSHEIYTGRAYLCKLPSGRTINIFFYNGGLSHGIGFGQLLNDGKSFADRLVQAANGDPSRLVNVAVDGETFGHHHRYGDMALSFSIDYLEKTGLLELTVYGEYLEKYPAEYEVEILENSSWSCAHGVERWRSDCGCNSGAHPGWSQTWRTPLRNSLDWLRDEINKFAEKEKAFSSLWEARDKYIVVLLERTKTKEFAEFHMNNMEANISRAVKLMELQRYLMFMYTSCGWFFDDIDGLESRLVLRFAIRAIQIAKELFGVDFEPEFCSQLLPATSNMGEFQNGGEIVADSLVKEKVDATRVGVYIVISLLVGEAIGEIETFHYQIVNYHADKMNSDKIESLTGELILRDIYTLEETEITFFVKSDLSFDIFAYILPGIDPMRTRKIFRNISGYLENSQIKGLNAYLLDTFKDSRYSLQHLFHDKQNEISSRILKEAVVELQKTQNRIIARNYKIINYFHSNALTIPKSIFDVVENTISEKLKDIFLQEEIDTLQLKKYLKRAKKFSVSLNPEELQLTASRKIHDLLYKLYKEDRMDLVDNILETLEILFNSSFDLNVAKAQNLYYRIWKEKYSQPEMVYYNGEERKKDLFLKVGNYLRMSLA